MKIGLSEVSTLSGLGSQATNERLGSYNAE